MLALPAARGPLERIFPPTRAGAVRLALAVHLAILLGATLVGWGEHGRALGLGVWRRWDTTHYLRIAGEGYGGAAEQGGPLMSAFLPLYPLLLRGLSAATASPIAAGLLLSAGASLLASAALFEIVALDAARGTARRAVAWLNVYPTSFFLVAAYTEATFLALVLCAFLAARRDRFLAASLAAAAAGATRITGAAVLPALLLETWLVTRERRDRGLVRRASVVALVAPLGTATYLAMNALVYGNPLEFLRHQEVHWQHVLSTPWNELLTGLGTMLGGPPSVERFVLSDANVLTVVLLAATVAFCAVSLRASYALYAVAAGWLATAVTWNISGPRYAIAVWPLFWMLGRATRRPWAGALLGALSGFALAAVALRFMAEEWAF